MPHTPRTTSMVDPWVATKYILCNANVAGRLLHLRRSTAISPPTAYRWFKHDRVARVGPFKASAAYGNWGRKLTLARSIEAATFGHVKVRDMLSHSAGDLVTKPLMVPQPTTINRIHPEWRKEYTSGLRRIIEYVRQVGAPTAAKRFGLSVASLREVLQCEHAFTPDQSVQVHRLTGVPYHVLVNVELATRWRVRQDEIIARIDDAND